MKRTTIRAVAGIAAAVAGAGAFAQESYPTRPVKLVVSSSPGGGTDTTARLIGPKLSELLGQQLVIENRPGAASMIGTEYVARSAPDGYTLLIVPSTMTIVPSTYKKIRFDPVKDFAPISQVVVVPQLLVGHPSVPAKNVKELIALAKSNPGKLDYAAGGYGGNPHLSMVLFLSMSGTNITYVPYKSGNAGLVDLMSGQISVMMGNILSVLQHVEAGRLRPYGVTTSKRAAGAPNIPTIAEAGVPGYEAIQWFGILAPAGTPRDIVTRLHRDIVRTVGDPEVTRRFAADGGEAHTSATPEAFGAFIRSEIAKWAKVVADAHLTRM